MPNESHGMTTAWTGHSETCGLDSGYIWMLLSSWKNSLSRSSCSITVLLFWLCSTKRAEELSLSALTPLQSSGHGEHITEDALISFFLFWFCTKPRRNRKLQLVDRFSFNLGFSCVFISPPPHTHTHKKNPLICEIVLIDFYLWF